LPAKEFSVAEKSTEQLALEGKVRESERRFKETAEMLPGVICEADLDLKITYVNKKGLSTLGYSPREFEQGVYIHQLLLEEDQMRAQQDIKNVLGGDFGNPAEYRLRCKDGGIIDLLVNTAPITISGEIKGLRFCIIDITDRKRAEEKLKESEARFKSFFNQSPIGIALLDENGSISEMNNAFRCMFVAGLAACHGERSLNVFDMLNFGPEAKKALDNGTGEEHDGWFDGAALRGVERKTGESGLLRYFDWHLTLLGSASKSPKTYLVQVQDITERKEAEDAALLRAQEETQKARALVVGLRKEILRNATFQAMVSRSQSMQKIFDILPEVAQASATVLVLGESGTGKELIARTLHELSPRKGRPFIAINCSALPDTLLESELFGYKAGAFTDAKKDKPGKFAMAEGGTLFLDEIGDVSAAVQSKLLRVLQEKTFEPLGGTAQVQAHVRIVAATNSNLTDLVKKGKFREDLFYRINVLSIKLPPLRERRGDIPLLCEHFIEKFNGRYEKAILEISKDALELIIAHDFPGNIRELENIIEHAFVFCKGPAIQLDHLPEDLRRGMPLMAEKPLLSGIKNFDELEKVFLENVLMETGGNKILAAGRLGIDKSTLFRKLKKLGI